MKDKWKEWKSHFWTYDGMRGDVLQEAIKLANCCSVFDRIFHHDDILKAAYAEVYF